MQIHAGFMVAGLLVALAARVGHVSEQASEQSRNGAARVVHANELIRQARIAVGGEEALRSLTSLSISARLHRFVKYVFVKSPTEVEEREKTLSGRVSIEFLLPDRYRRNVSTSTLIGTKYSYTEIISGGRAWRDPPLLAESSSKDRHAIDVSDFERSLAYQAINARQQLTFYSLAWLLRELPDYPIEFVYEGWLQTKDGKAEAITAHRGDEFQSLLLLNQETHLPLGFISRFIASQAEPVLANRTFFFSVAYLRGLQQRARRERAAQLAKPSRRSEWQMRLTDHRRVGGLLLPHRLTMMVDGTPVEELVITKYEINRRMNPRDFERKP